MRKAIRLLVLGLLALLFALCGDDLDPPDKDEVAVITPPGAQSECACQTAPKVDDLPCMVCTETDDGGCYCTYVLTEGSQR